MTPPTHPLAVDVRALLQRPLSELRGFTDPAGRPVSPRQARTALVAEQASGHELLPIGGTHQFSFIKK